jgi:tRNA(Ile)-lysidine synthase
VSERARGGARKAPPPAVRAFVARARRTIERRALFKGGERTIVAVSGGPDSLALLHAMARVAKELSLELHVAHFDHRLRDGSAEDARFVEREAEKLGLPFHLGVADDTAKPKGRSPEEAARNRRHSYLHSLARELGASRIAFGHTLDDQAETVLINLFTGAGRRGLGGMPPRRWFVVRPLIDLRRSDTEAFCRALKLEPRRDPTNDAPEFLRNVIRHEVMPYLAGRLNARLPEALARSSDVIRDEDYLLDRLAGDAGSPEHAEDGSSRFDLEAFAPLDPALQRRAIRIAARTLDVALSAEQCEAVRSLALEGATGASLDLPAPLNARVEYGFLFVGRAPSHAPAQGSVSLTIPGETERGGAIVRSWITSERPAGWPDGKTTAVFDADRVAFPLRVRRWRAGDRFRPLGMSRGEKKVGDFFTDTKVPKGERAGVDIVTGEDGAIVWLGGHRIDDRAKVTDRTRRFLWLEWENAT